MKHLSIEEATNLVNKVAHPTQLASFTKERLDFLNVCLFVKNNKISEKDVLKNKQFIKLYQDYHKKYFYVKTDFKNRVIISPKYFADEIYLELKNTKDISKEIKKINDELKKLSKIKKESTKLFKLTPEEKRLIKIVEDTILLMDYRKEGMTKQFYYIISLMHEIAERKGQTYSTVEQLYFEEFLDFLDDKFEIDLKIINQRKKAIFVVYQKGKDKQLIYGKEAENLFALTQYKSNEIKGNVASSCNKNGIIGIAKIITDPNKEKFNKGEILVTSMTRIEYVPLMKKAKAIVTDEGGIACHAAIVSRELGVPCIIGTKNATKMIKDGNKIKLNLNNGKIIIINK
jgi:phosphoenolpyruvate synthase/pyruvate phosphate dikinase